MIIANNAIWSMEYKLTPRMIGRYYHYQDLRTHTIDY